MSEILIPKIIAVVLGVFLSPTLPDGMINVGDPCEQAMAIVHEHGLALVDQEFAPELPLNNKELVVDQGDNPFSDLLGAFTLSYDRAESQSLSYHKKHKRSKAGILVCGLAIQQDPL